jgi:protoheme IX farnesyltransferase
MVLGLFAFISYVFIYTPMKRISTWAVFVGAFPGAIPPMLGAVAGSDSFGLIPGVLFLVQFVWQFSHFWAIAWVLYEDYLQGGFSLLPSKEGPNKTSAFQIAVYSFALIPFSLLPWLLDWTGITTAVVAGVLTTLYYLLSLRLLKSLEKKDAKRLMFASFIILPILQFLYVLDRNPETIEAALKAVF